MDSYEPKDVTEKAKALSTGKILSRIKDGDIKISFNRVIKRGSIEKGPKGIKIKTMGIDALDINREKIELRAVEQIVDHEQITAIGYIMKWAEENAINGTLNIEEVTDVILINIKKKGLIDISGNGNLAMPRKQEIMAAFNRYRKLRV